MRDKGRVEAGRLYRSKETPAEGESVIVLPRKIASANLLKRPTTERVII